MPPTLEGRLDALAEGLRELSRDRSCGEDGLNDCDRSLAESPFFEKLDIGECGDPPDWETWSLNIILAPNNRSCSAPSRFESVVMLMPSARHSICFATALHMLVVLSRAVFISEGFLAWTAGLLGEGGTRLLLGEAGGFFGLFAALEFR
mmetsp:Transcript_56044/g.147193  ORF Transcript_56044/g.147193 Transcript_56044/m.147193 type:complete len:149 (+) Transcript_56044:374-820(+)